MSRIYTPSAIAAADLEIVAAPAFGGEWAVFASHTAAKRIGDIEMSASGTGIYTANSAVSISSGVRNLQIVATAYLRSTRSTVITLAATGAGSSMSATFAPPARVADQSFHFQRGYAQDLAPASAADVTAITGLTSILGGEQNVKFSIYELPDLSDYYQIGCTTDKNFNLKGRVAKGVDCGMETDAFVKRGKTKPAMLTISQKLKNFADGLARLDGGRATCLLVGIKDGQVTDERIVFTDWLPTNAVKLPDGEGEAMLDSEEGKYGEALIFVAP